jgi:hypothetical protein
MKLNRDSINKEINDLVELNKDKIKSVTFESGELIEIITDDKTLLDKLKQKGFI